MNTFTGKEVADHIEYITPEESDIPDYFINKYILPNDGWKNKPIKLKDLLSANNDDYAYFWEVTYNLSKKYSIFEVPVKLEFRKLGKSKMKLKHVIYSLFYLLKIALFRFK